MLVSGVRAEAHVLDIGERPEACIGGRDAYMTYEELEVGAKARGGC